MKVETPAARNTDAAPAHIAARQMTDSGKRHNQRLAVADAVRAFPGLTSYELAVCSDLGRYIVGRRLSECETAGDVRRGEQRQCTISERQALTWEPV